MIPCTSHKIKNTNNIMVPRTSLITFALSKKIPNPLRNFLKQPTKAKENKKLTSNDRFSIHNR